MQIKEQYQDRDAYVSFGPAAFNQSIYRVEVSVYPENTHAQVSLDDAAPQIINGYAQQLMQGYGTAPETLEEAKTKINGYDAVYRKMTQNIPAGKYMSNSSATFEHFIYVIDYIIGAGIVWVQIPTETHSPDPVLSPIEFAESLKLMPNKSSNPTTKSVSG